MKRFGSRRARGLRNQGGSISPRAACDCDVQHYRPVIAAYRMEILRGNIRILYPVFASYV